MKGATSFRIIAVKNVKAYEANVRRTPEYMEHISIDARNIRTELTRFNEVLTSESLEGGSLTGYLDRLRDIYQEKVGQRMQAKARPIREAVVRIKEETRMRDLERLAKSVEDLLGCRCLLIAIHRDEGKWEGDQWRPFHHAHMVLNFMDQETGKTIRWIGKDTCRMLQDIATQALGMPRGESKINRNGYIEEVIAVKDGEIARLKDELAKTKADLQTAENNATDAKKAIEMYKEELLAMRQQLEQPKDGGGIIKKLFGKR